MNRPIKKFVLRTLLAALPVFLLVAFYIVRDPFHVVHPVTKNAAQCDSVIAGNNAGFTSVETYLAHDSEQHYDSFIFGSSMSQNFKARYWQPYIGKDASILHFDQSAETLEGIINKMRFLNEHGTTIKNALIVIEEKLLRLKPVENDILFAQHPSTTSACNWFNFHCIFFNALRNTTMLRKALLNSFDKENELKKKELNDRIADRIDITNEVYYPIIDSLIEHDPGKFFTPERLASRLHAVLPAQLAPAIDEKVEAQLLTIKELLESNGTNYIIIVPPCNHKPSLMETDLWVMKAVFGQDKVHDFSSTPRYINNERLYYDRDAHLITAECKVLLDIAYKEQASKSISNPYFRLK